VPPAPSRRRWATSSCLRTPAARGCRCTGGGSRGTAAARSGAAAHSGCGRHAMRRGARCTALHICWLQRRACAHPAWPCRSPRHHTAQGLCYSATEGDEVEDLLLLLAFIKVWCAAASCVRARSCEARGAALRGSVRHAMLGACCSQHVPAATACAHRMMHPAGSAPGHPGRRIRRDRVRLPAPARGECESHCSSWLHRCSTALNAGWWWC
jgi:hypothetical protein